MDLENICPHCLVEVKNKKTLTSCPHCRKLFSESAPVGHQLPMQTILAGKYLIGDVIGEGGFGITYIALDLNLELRVAIKEFYPNGFVSREATNTTTLTYFTGQDEEAVKKWRDSFIGEAQRLAKCSHLSGVVGVRDYFMENLTAYIVLEFLEGETLKEYVKKRQGKIPVGELLPALEPIFVALREVHKQNLIHRDISPDNIMRMPDGGMKLLDFGAARDVISGNEKSLSVMLKPGYAPEEQYRSKGKQGPWSDIYALAGTIYRCITGVVPPESMERMRQDTLQRPSAMGIPIDPQIENALMKALEVYAENRFQTMQEFYDAIYKNGNISAATAVSITPPPEPAAAQPSAVREEPMPAKNSRKGLFAVLGALLVAVIGTAAYMITDLNKMQQESENMVVAESTQETEDTENSTVESAAEEVEQEAATDTKEEDAEEVEEEEQEEALYDPDEEKKIHHYIIAVDDKKMTWKQAEKACEEMGGYLVRINTKKEYKKICEELENEGVSNTSLWIGGARKKGEYAYYWTYGFDDNSHIQFGDDMINSSDSPLDSYWLNAGNGREPSFTSGDDGTDETRLDLIQYNGSWCLNDVPANLEGVVSSGFGYICEYE